jgi:hypothetical protein
MSGDLVEARRRVDAIFVVRDVCQFATKDFHFTTIRDAHPAKEPGAQPAHPIYFNRVAPSPS